EMYVTKPLSRTMTFVLRSSIPMAQVLTAVRQIVKQVDTNLPLIRPGTMQALVDRQMARTQFCLLLAGLFAILAIVLAGVGTYGVVAYAVVQRTREIGLRVALGASPGKLVSTIMWGGFKPVLIGLGAGICGAFALTRAMRSLLFQVRPNDAATFIAVSLLL